MELLHLGVGFGQEDAARHEVFSEFPADPA
jgi:hypothetical protein